MQTIRHDWLQLNASLWFVPLACGVASVALALWLVTAPPALGDGPVSGLLYGGDIGSARDLLAALLIGMITMTSLVVSITIVVLTLAAAQLGPRLIRNFTEDRVTQAVLGLFVATILYLLIVLRSIEGDGEAPHLAVSTGTALSGACLFVLLFYIDRLANSIVSDTIAHRLTQALIAASGRAEALAAAGGPGGDGVGPTWNADDCTVTACEDGYIRSIDLVALSDAARDADVVIRLHRRTGQWVIRGSALAGVHPGERAPKDLADRIRRAVVIGAGRTPTQHVAFELQRLVEMAVRALSPGINDPYTAIVTIDNLGSCLAHLARRPFEPEMLHDAAGRLRVVQQVPGWPSLVDVLGVIGTAAWLFGSEVRAQLQGLIEAVPGAWRSLRERIDGIAPAGWLEGGLADSLPAGSSVLSAAQSIIVSLGSGLTDLLVVVVGGVYLASQPDRYRGGLLQLVPASRRTLVGEALDDCGRALRKWLLGQSVSMLLVGGLTALGLWWIGVPSPLALGLLAGLLDFVPIVGPIVALVPALILALAQDPQTALWTVGLYLALQQLEGNVLQPMVQQRAVDLPAALLIFAILAAGLLFGGLGVVLAAPITVVVFVPVKRRYVREALDTPTDLPGEPRAGG